MSSHDRKKVPNAILAALVGALDRALGEACSLPWKAKTAEGEAAPAEMASATSIVLRFNGSWTGEATLVFQSSDLAKLGFKEAASGADAARLADILEETVRGMTAGMAKLLEEHGPMTIQAETAPALPRTSEDPTELLLQADGAEPPISMHVYCDSNLTASAQMSSSKAFSFPEATPAANLDLVLDVALNVTLRFGQRQLALREVLDLTSGSVVELDRQVDEPVELVLDGRVIARGEAVIIDGSYGMRITQVVQQIIP